MFRSDTDGFFEKLDKHASIGVSLKNVLIVGLLGVRRECSFWCASYNIPMQIKNFRRFEQVPISEAFKRFITTAFLNQSSCVFRA